MTYLVSPACKSTGGISNLEESQFARNLLSALETDLTTLLRDELTSEDGWDAEIIEQAKGRLNEDPRSSIGNRTFVDYLYFQQKIEAVSVNRERLEMTSRGQAFVLNLDDLFKLHGIRNDLFHPRPITAEDQALLVSICSSIVRSGFIDGEMINVLTSPERQHLALPSSGISSGVLNNLPPPEYDDTGFVGRRALTNQLVKEIKSKNHIHSFIWLTGVGGTGKTAIAREVASRLLADPDRPFDLILWVSFKTHELGAMGTDRIRDSILNASQAFADLHLHPGDEVQSLKSLFADLGELETLVVLDNCETYPGDIEEIVKAEPPTSLRFLFTSRRIGEFGRSVPVPPMESSECRYFLGKLAKTFPSEAVDDVLRNPESFRTVLASLGMYPLGLKWMARAFNSGTSLENVIKNRDIVFRYCVENVYESLSAGSRELLHHLFASRDSHSVGDLKVIFDNKTVDEILAQVTELVRVGLVSQVDQELRRTYTVSDITREFLTLSEVLTTSERQEIQKRISKLAKKPKGTPVDIFSPYVIADSALEPLVAGSLSKLLRSKTGRSGSENNMSLEERVVVARQLVESAPRYWETYRVLGEILSWLGDFEQSVELHRKAEARCPRDQIDSYCRALYLLGIKLAKIDEVESAQVLQRALKVKEHHVTLLAYGRSLMFLARFDEAEELLRKALSLAQGRNQQFFAHKAILQCIKRRCEVSTNREQLESAIRGLHYWLSNTELTFDCPQNEKDDVVETVTDCVGYFAVAIKSTNSQQEIESSERSSHALLLNRIDSAISALGFVEWPKSLESTSRHFLVHFSNVIDLLGDCSSELVTKTRRALDQSGLVTHPIVEGALKVWYQERRFGFVNIRFENKLIEAYINPGSFVSTNEVKDGLPGGSIVQGRLIGDAEGKYFLRQARILR